jgi:hypothetical protein
VNCVTVCLTDVSLVRNIGDELVCSGVHLSNFSSLVKQLRLELGPNVILYANECCGTIGACDSKHRCWEGPIPPELDLISEDCYSAPCRVPEGTPYGCNETKPYYERRNVWNVSWEWTDVKGHYESSIFPRLHPHQQVMLVPGIFGFSNTSIMSHDRQDKFLVELLQGFW